MYIIANSEDPYWQSFLLFFYNMHTTTSARCFIQYRRSAMEILNNVGWTDKLLGTFYNYCMEHGFKYEHNALTEFNVMKLKWLESFMVGDIYGGDDFTIDEFILIINLITDHANYYKNKIKTLEHRK